MTVDPEPRLVTVFRVWMTPVVPTPEGRESPWCSNLSHHSGSAMHAGEAYTECLKTDHMVQLIRHEAFGKVKSGGKLEEQLQAMTSRVARPEMPKTAAVLQSIAASDHHPGAIYRLAGDRCVLMLGY